MLQKKKIESGREAGALLKGFSGILSVSLVEKVIFEQRAEESGKLLTLENGPWREMQGTGDKGVGTVMENLS